MDQPNFHHLVKIITSYYLSITLLTKYVNLFREKFKAFEAFKNFKVVVENQNGQKIKALCSGGEYISNTFKQFCEDHGIHYSLTILTS